MKFATFIKFLRIAIVTVLFAIFIAEGMVRLFGSISVDECGLFIPDPINHFAPKPNYSTLLASSEYSVQVTTDSFGHRNSPGKISEEASQRILFLGDSFTFGLGVEEQEAFPQLTERYLRAMNKSVVVYNAGVIGHGTIHEYNELVNMVPSFKPDVIVLVFFANDPADNDLFEETAVYEGCLVFRNESNKWLKNNLRRYSKAYTFFGHIARGFLPTASSATITDTTKTVDWFRKISSYSKSIDAKLVIVLIPTAAGGTWLETTDLTGFTVINMQNTLKSENYFSWDGHLKPPGHVLVAQAITNQLVNYSG